MTIAEFRAGLKVVVVRNTVSAHRQTGAYGYIQPGEEIVITGVYPGRPHSDFYYTTSDGSTNTIPANDVRPVGPRVKKSPPVDVWEAARGYIR